MGGLSYRCSVSLLNKPHSLSLSLCAHRGPPPDHAHTAIDAHSAAQTDRNGMDSAGADVMRADCSGTKTGNSQIQYIPCRATEKGQVYIIPSFPSSTLNFP